MITERMFSVKVKSSKSIRNGYKVTKFLLCLNLNVSWEEFLHTDVFGQKTASMKGEEKTELLTKDRLKG